MLQLTRLGLDPFLFGVLHDSNTQFIFTIGFYHIFDDKHG
jgi:hypothetical protein